MASSKTALLILFGLFALVLLVSAEVSSTTSTSDEVKGVDQHGGGGYPGRGGGGGGDYPGRGGGGSGYPGRGGGGSGYPGRGGGGGRCYYGCCRGYRYSNGCKRCCAHANEAPDAFFEDDAKN